MSETTAEEREWLSRNWTPSDPTFRQWIAGSTKVYKLIPCLIADVDRLEKERVETRRLVSDQALAIADTKVQLEKVIQLERNIVNNIRAMKSGDQASLYEFSDFLISLEKQG